MVLKAIRRLKLPALIDPKPSRQRIPAMIVQRLPNPPPSRQARLWHPRPWRRNSP